jgi:beta-phosphoglucomutase
MIRGVLFDMDGVLVDSESFICEAAIIMFSELGAKVTCEDFKPFVGTGENRYLGGVAEKHGISIDLIKDKARTYEIYKQIIKGHLLPLPGALEFVDKCRAKGLKLAIATSADYVKMEANLDEITLPSSTFDATVNGLEVVNKKPAPDIYLMAAGKLGLRPEQCLVVEDAVSGVRAARAAGCRCLAVTTSFSRDNLSEADWICDNLSYAPDDALQW